MPDLTPSETRDCYAIADKLADLARGSRYGAFIPQGSKEKAVFKLKDGPQEYWITVEPGGRS